MDQSSLHPQDAGQHLSRNGSGRGGGRGPLSCAECRRLKLKCDRVWPCQPCIRRGCRAICPEGSLVAGKSNRFILEGTKQLHERIEALSNRIRELEDALRDDHAQITPEQHPLLREDLLLMKAPLDAECEINDKEKWTAQPKTKTEDEELANELHGTLTISGNSGASQFFGGTASSLHLVPDDEEIRSTHSSPLPASGLALLPPEISALAHSFPFTAPGFGLPGQEEAVRTQIFGLMPPLSEAWQLVEAFYEHGSWQYDAVPRAQVHDVLLNIYDFEEFPQARAHLEKDAAARAHQAALFHLSSTPVQSPVSITAPEEDAVSDDEVGAHDVALLLMVLALGTLVSPHRPAFDPRAETLHQLARASMVLEQSVLDESSLATVQALYLMCFYHQLSDSKSAPANSWALLGLAAKLAQSIGLHRDSGKWNLDPDQTRTRRTVFWELFTFDQLQSLGFGRPPSFTLSHVDCEIPSPGEESYHAWKFSFSSQVLTQIIDQAFGAKAPAYSTILGLDKKVREHPVPQGMKMQQPAELDSMGLVMQRHALNIVKEITVMYLHRSFFARAITDHPDDPYSSKFASSVHATVSSAMNIVGTVNSLYHNNTNTARFWFFWTHAFSAAMVLGSFVARSPNAGNAQDALSTLDLACTLFERAATVSRVAGAKALPIMLRLQHKARAALSHAASGTAPTHRRGRASLHIITAPKDDDLALLGGTSVVHRRPSPSPSGSRRLSRSPSGRSRGSRSAQGSPLPSPGGAGDVGGGSGGGFGSGGLLVPQPAQESLSAITPTARNAGNQLPWVPAAHFELNDAIPGVGYAGAAAAYPGSGAFSPHATASLGSFGSPEPSYGSPQPSESSYSSLADWAATSGSVHHRNGSDASLNAQHQHQHQHQYQQSMPQHTNSMPVYTNGTLAPHHAHQQQHQQHHSRTHSLPQDPLTLNVAAPGTYEDSLPVPSQGVSPISPSSPWDVALMGGRNAETVGFARGDASLDSEWVNFLGETMRVQAYRPT